MVLYEGKGFTRDFYDLNPQGTATRIKILLKDRTWVGECVVRFPLGHPSRACARQRICSKFLANLRPIFSEQELEKLQTALDDDGCLFTSI